MFIFFNYHQYFWYFVYHIISLLLLLCFLNAMYCFVFSIHMLLLLSFSYSLFFLQTVVLKPRVFQKQPFYLYKVGVRFVYTPPSLDLTCESTLDMFVVFPDLYRLTLLPRSCLASNREHEGWNFHFRGLLNDWKMGRLAKFLATVEPFQGLDNNNHDKLIRKIHSMGNFTLLS